MANSEAAAVPCFLPKRRLKVPCTEWCFFMAGFGRSAPLPAPNLRRHRAAGRGRQRAGSERSGRNTWPRPAPPPPGARPAPLLLPPFVPPALPPPQPQVRTHSFPDSSPARRSFCPSVVCLNCSPAALPRPESALSWSGPSKAIGSHCPAAHGDTHGSIGAQSPIRCRVGFPPPRSKAPFTRTDPCKHQRCPHSPHCWQWAISDTATERQRESTSDHFSEASHTAINSLSHKEELRVNE